MFEGKRPTQEETLSAPWTEKETNPGRFSTTDSARRVHFIIPPESARKAAVPLKAD